MAPPLLVFSDLDGTLLDHESYAYAGAEAALRRLHGLGIPLVLNSSKTCAEMVALQAELGLVEPFIAENGGGIFVPPGHPLATDGRLRPLGGCRGIAFGSPYGEVRGHFAALREAYGLRGFGDMTAAEIAQRTGLSEAQARLAARRDFSEPFLFLGPPRPEALAAEVAAAGLQVTRGGRFFHLLAATQSKGRAVKETARLFHEAGGQPVTLGLGDAENDLPMLEAVDIPGLIPGPDGRYAPLALPGLRHAPGPGSRGWGAAVTAILDELLGSQRHGAEGRSGV